jgi:hypothetical protein
VVIVSLLVPSWNAVTDRTTTARAAGTGGIPGVRETGEWIEEYTPENSVFVAIGPSMANLIQFYGHRKAYGLSVSSNPLNRNPSYYPLVNPDAKIRYGEVQYLVWDSFTASRSPFFTNSLMKYIDRYDAQVAFVYSIPADSGDGADQDFNIIVIYEVRPR